MFGRKKTFLDNFVTPKPSHTGKSVVILSALTGVASAAAANFFSKKSNRDQTKKTVSNLSKQFDSLKDKVITKANKIKENFEEAIHNESVEIKEKIANLKVDKPTVVKTKVSKPKPKAKPVVTVDVEAKEEEEIIN
jgi:gas vesicle protein